MLGGTCSIDLGVEASHFRMPDVREDKTHAGVAVCKGDKAMGFVACVASVGQRKKLSLVLKSKETIAVLFHRPVDPARMQFYAGTPRMREHLLGMDFPAF